MSHFSKKKNKQGDSEDILQTPSLTGQGSENPLLMPSNHKASSEFWKKDDFRTKWSPSISFKFRVLSLQYLTFMKTSQCLQTSIWMSFKFHESWGGVRLKINQSIKNQMIIFLSKKYSSLRVSEKRTQTEGTPKFHLAFPGAPIPVSQVPIWPFS